MSGAKTFTYDSTSPSHSFTFKFRWTAGDTPRFNLYPDANGAFPFALSVKYPNQSGFGATAGPNGSWDLDPSKTSNIVDMNNAIIPGMSYDIEYGRLKVASGPNAGKYYIYVKANDELVAENYYDGVAADGTYIKDSNQYQVNNTLTFEVHGVNGTKISGIPEAERYDAYDELNFTDLYLGGQPVTGAVELHGGQTYTYDRTSPSYSAILHFNWTAGDIAKFQMSFDKTADGSMSYPFGIWVKEPNGDGAGAFGDVWFLPGQSQNAHYVFDHAVMAGESYEFEIGRLKVLNGANAGKYYTYLKINKELVAQAYTEVGADGQYTFSQKTLSLSNEILFGYWTSATTNNYGRLAPVVEETEYEPYDVVNYEDLLKNGQPVGGSTTLTGGSVLTYNKTSPTGSVILKYRWTVGSVPKFQLSFDKTASDAMDYRFGAWLSEPSADYPNGKMWLCPGYGPQINLPTALVSGSSHNIEFARLKVKKGVNAGKYYVYINIDDETIAEYYVGADVVDANGQYLSEPHATTCTLSNEIFWAFWGSENNSISMYLDPEDIDPDPEALYYDYDVINYADLKDESGKALGDETTFTAAKMFTYNRTSPTGSAILKYRWTVGTKPSFQLSFDHAYESNGTTKSIGYMFGAWLSEPDEQFPNGRLWLRPGYGPQVNLPVALEEDNIYDIEFARLKVAKGANKGKYYVYLKIDGQLIAESYTDVNVVGSNNHYITKPGVNNATDATISNKIYMTYWGSYGNTLSDTWDIGKGYYVYYYANGNLVEKVPFLLDDPSVVGKEPAVPTIPNAVGEWEPHPVTGLTKALSVYANYTVTAPSSTSADISLNAFNGTTVDLKTDIVNAYLATPMAQQTNYVRNYHHTTSGYQDYQNITFRWSDLGNNSSYTAYFADNADFDDAFIVTTTEKELVKKVGIFVPGKTYYWFVAGNDTGVCSAVDTFTALDAPARYITAGAVTNMRDEGGYTTVNGQTVNYGLVYRGASLDEDHSHVDDMARSVFRYLGINSEIELRGGNVHRRTGWDSGNTNVYYINATGYSPILNLDADQKAQYKATFEAMADRSNYPFYFHCSAGADRTGTFGYLLNGLLGVPYETLRADYELTSFSEVGRRTADEWTDGDSFDLMHNTLMAQYDDGSGDVQAAIEKFLMQHIGLDQATLDAIKVIMLESDPYDLDLDGDVDADDVVLLKQAILSGSNNTKFDVNKDNYIDVRDVVSMKKHFAA